LTEVLRIWGGSYHDYWFTDDAILKVRLVPQAITLLGIVVLVGLTALLGIVGVIIGAAVAALIYVTSGRLAKGRRDQIASMSVQEVREKGLVTLRIPYSVVSGAQIKGARLTISVEGRKVRVKVPQDSLQEVQMLLRSKMGDSFSVLAE
jgi:hypothetical protein